MNTGFSLKQQMAGAGLAVALVTAGCATTPTLERYPMPPQGATWTTAVTLSGSFGSGSRQTKTIVGTESWEGRSMTVFQGQPMTTFVDSNGCWVAQAAAGKPVFSWNPPICYRYPLSVGNAWLDARRMTLHQTNASLEVESHWNVSAYEEITVPAGKFAAYRITYSATDGVDRVDWFSPALGIHVKSSVRRTDRNPSGPGSVESELIAHTIQR